jgi:hypothetical protein
LTIRQLDVWEDNIELALSPLIVRSGALLLHATIKRVVNIPSIKNVTVRLTQEDAKMRKFALSILPIIYVENVLEIERSFLVIFWLINRSISV